MKRIFMIVWSISVVFLLYITLSNYTRSESTAAYRWGSRGTVVREIQSKLKRWGYYKGGVDGVYGYGTVTAVKKFQRYNGLRADGVAGTSTLAALGINTRRGATGRVSTGSHNVSLLSRIINGEARGEPFVGQVAVGAVIMNRTRDPRFPHTIAGVVYQPGAFTAVVDGQIQAPLEESPTRAARDAINGWDPSGGAIYYYNPAKTTNKWIWSRPIIKKIGDHIFCK